MRTGTQHLKGTPRKVWHCQEAVRSRLVKESTAITGPLLLAISAAEVPPLRIEKTP